MLRRLINLAERLPLVAGRIVVAGAMGLFLAGMFGGFDFTDEGAYYLSFAQPENTPAGNTSYFIFGGRIFAVLGHNIVAMRFVTLVTMCVAAWIFLSGWRKFVRAFGPGLPADGEHWEFTAALVVAASLLGFTISPATLSYNFQNAFCLLAASGLLLNATSQPRSVSRFDAATMRPLLFFVLLVGLQFFIKFSSSVVLGAIGGLFFLLVSRKSPAQKGALAALLLLCLAAVALLYFFFFQSFARWWEGIGGIARLITKGSYTSTFFQRYADEIGERLLVTFQDFGPVLIVAVAALLFVCTLRRWPGWQARAAGAAGLWIFAHVLWLVQTLGYHSAIGQIGLPFFSGSLILLGLLSTGSRLATGRLEKSADSTPWRLFAGGALLVTLPFIGAFGTSNSICQNAFYQLTPWFAVVVLLLTELDRTWKTSWATRLGAVLLAVVIGCQFFTGYWLEPYRVTGNRYQQTASVPVGEPATTLWLHPDTRDFILKVRQCLQEHGFKPGDDLLVFFDLPGLVFAMGGSSPGHQWYFQGDRAALEDSVMHFRFIDPARRARAFLVRNGNWDEFLPYLRDSGVRFPEDYQLITPPMVSPFTRVKFEIWQPKTKSAGR